MRGRLLATCVLFAALLLPGPAQSAVPAATKAQATAIVKTLVRKNATKCRLAIRTVTAKRIPVGWRVTVTVTIRGQRGAAAWHVKGRTAMPADPFAKTIGKGCAR
ncbi:MAG: hypothetical protein ABR583_10590 [Gaiellaceae bacterium]